MVGRAAARVKTSGNSDRRLWASPYYLSKNLEHKSEALEAARGVLNGAPKSFVARLDRITVLRRWDADNALEAARLTLVHRASFNDTDEVIRIYLNELARCALQCEQPSLALGAAALGLGGRFRYPLDYSQASYMLKSFYDAGLSLRRQNAREASNIPELTLALSRHLLTPSELSVVAGNYPAVVVPAEIAGRTSSQLATTLQSQLGKFARHAAEDLDLFEYLPGPIDFTWVSRT